MAIQGTDPRLVVALLVDGRLRTLEHARADNVEEIATRYRMQAEEAGQRGCVWVVEVVDPDGELPAVRMSNDPAQMQPPVLLTPEATQEWLDQIAP